MDTIPSDVVLPLAGDNRYAWNLGLGLDSGELFSEKLFFYAAQWHDRYVKIDGPGTFLCIQLFGAGGNAKLPGINTC